MLFATQTVKNAPSAFVRAALLLVILMVGLGAARDGKIFYLSSPLGADELVSVRSEVLSPNVYVGDEFYVVVTILYRSSWGELDTKSLERATFAPFETRMASASQTRHGDLVFYTRKYLLQAVSALPGKAYAIGPSSVFIISHADGSRHKVSVQQVKVQIARRFPGREGTLAPLKGARADWPLSARVGAAVTAVSLALASLAWFVFKKFRRSEASSFVTRRGDSLRGEYELISSRSDNARVEMFALEKFAYLIARQRGRTPTHLWQKNFPVDKSVWAALWAAVERAYAREEPSRADISKARRHIESLLKSIEGEEQ